MNKYLRNASIAAVAALAIILVLPFVVPTGVYRSRIESAAAHATGRTLRIEGPLRLMLFPQFGLKADEELTLSAGALRVRGLRLGRTAVGVTLAGGVLTARLDPMTLYGGGHAELGVDGRGAVPRFHGLLKFESVSLGPFLDDTLGVGRIEGTGSLSLEVDSQGANANAVMHALSGRGAITAGRGRIRGVAGRAPPSPFGDCLRVDPVTGSQFPQARLTMLYRSTDRLSRRGAAVKNLSLDESLRRS